MSDVTTTGTSGTAGGAGGYAYAYNPGGPDPANSAEATGGAGGPIGAGGAGGAGGAALAKVAFALSTGSAITATATGAGGAGGDSGQAGDYSAGGTAGAGGAAGALASATNGSAAQGSSAQASASASGGVGGNAFGAGGAGGVGGRAAGVYASADGESAYASAYQAGGSGGAGYDGASGGAGAASSLVDAVSAVAASGIARLTQTAVGGAGGASHSGTAAGAAGSGASALTASETTTALVDAYVSGRGGYGGRGYGGAAGSAGGNGAAALELTAVGAVGRGQASAYGGRGGGSYGPGNGAAGGSAAASASDIGDGLAGVTAYASARGGGGGLAAVTGSGGGGGDAQSHASATNAVASGGPAYAAAGAVGGAGGSGVGAGLSGGTGGEASGSSANASGFSARAQVNQTGGAGGQGSGGAAGGAGADSILDNAASGASHGGYLYLAQWANGGAGGYGAWGGGGGAAQSILSASLSAPGYLKARVGASGGAGGGAAQGAPGAGGDAAASAILGGQSGVYTYAEAVGGAAGGAASGGAASAYACAITTSAAAVQASARAVGGAGSRQGTAGATAKARGQGAAPVQALATAAGSYGAALAQADLSGGALVTQLTSAAQAPAAAYGVSAQALADVGGPSEWSGEANNAFALWSAQPGAAFLASAFAANPNVAAISSGAIIAGLGSPDAAVFGVGEQGLLVASAASAGDYVASQTFTLNATALSGHLIVGLIGSQASGGTTDLGDFSSLTFTVSVDGATVVTDSFSSLAAAQAFFSDNALDAGAFASTPGLTVEVCLDVKSATAGFAFSSRFVIGATDGSAPPVVSAPAYVDVRAGRAQAIAGVSVNEASPLAAGQTLTVTLSDNFGILDVTAGEGSIIGAGTKRLSITGTVAQVDADLAGLTYASGSTGGDTVSIVATDSRTGMAAPLVIAIVDPLWFTCGPDHLNGGAGNDLFIATDGALQRQDWADGGGGTNTLELDGPGVFDLSAPAHLAHIQVVTAKEGQPYYHDGPTRISSQAQTIILRDGMDGVSVDVAPASLDPANPLAPTITIVGAHNDDVINLASGNDTVIVGSAEETVHGGSGADTIIVDRHSIGAVIDGGTSGRSVLIAKGGGWMRMGAAVTDIARVEIAPTDGPVVFLANGLAGLTVDDLNTKAADRIAAGGAGQTLEGGGDGSETFVGFGGGATTYADPAWRLDGDAIRNFSAGDRIDVTGLAMGADISVSYARIYATQGVLTLWDGRRPLAQVELFGQIAASSFNVQSDGGGGTLILDAPPSKNLMSAPRG